MATPKKDTRTAKKAVSTAAGTLALAAATASRAYAQASGTIRVGLLGCGGRGSGAIRQSLNSDPGIVVIATADLFKSKAEGARKSLMNDKRFKGKVKIPTENVFWGYDCHEKLARCDADLLVMATAPAFRGRQMLAAVKAGKHIFTEKPVASDPAGCRLVIEASEIAKKKGLGIVAGTQRRHEPNRMELMKRIHDGAIGELVGGQCYWYGGGIWYRGAGGDMSELEWQCHNWYHFTWLSGDQICEQHIHNIDIMNWCFNGPPKKFVAVGGRRTRDYSGQAKKVCKHFNKDSEKGWEKYNGDIWDHLFAEFEYPNGGRAISFSGHGPGSGRGGEKVVGTKGTSNCSNSYSGEKSWKYSGRGGNGQQLEHNDLVKSIRAGKPLNEGRRVAESTLTAIGARMAAATGRDIEWDWLLKESKLDLVPKQEDLKPGPGVFHPIASGGDKLV
ncbi:MAG: Gfo/Idh/MocA family oxidoreductase [Phycisphaerae bacterium]|nr:Gfo/Idh/MocA family oxidoreductase [Phycisphaerae bacterium]